MHQGGLPSSLESLAICRCEKLISRRMALGLQGLHSLRSFTISNHDEELESFPEEALLPPNLTDFTIGYLPNLKSLNGKGFQPLTSLKNLSIWSCHSLDCLLEDVLPTSLYQLQISCCCFLKERYGNEKGEGRVKIAHIPRISISWLSYESKNASAQVLILIFVNSHQATVKSLNLFHQIHFISSNFLMPSFKYLFFLN